MAKAIDGTVILYNVEGASAESVAQVSRAIESIATYIG